MGGRPCVALPRGEKIGATLYEIAPGRTSGHYHFHHGAEELLVVLRGRPTLREPAGERILEEGDVVLFPVGPDGAHQLSNRTDEPVRYLMVSNRPSPEAVEYPDYGQLSVMAFTDSPARPPALGPPDARGSPRATDPTPGARWAPPRGLESLHHLDVAVHLREGEVRRDVADHQIAPALCERRARPRHRPRSVRTLLARR